MTNVFISHASDDNAAARTLADWLNSDEGGGFDSLFLDFDYRNGIIGGDAWRETLYNRLARCQAVIVVHSRNWEASKWCFAEAVLAHRDGKRLIFVRVDPNCPQNSSFPDLQQLDLNAKDGRAKLCVALARVFEWTGKRPPYPGLASFDEQDAAIFFGRDAETQTILDRLEGLRRDKARERFLLILGASGSGKSSLMRAGAIPRLDDGRHRWLTLPTMTPSNEPFEALAGSIYAAYSRAGLNPPNRLDAELKTSEGSAKLCEILSELRLQTMREATVLLPIDQVDDLTAQTPTTFAFWRLLKDTLEQGHGWLMALGTLRSDLTGRFQDHPGVSASGLSSDEALPYDIITLDPLPHDRFRHIILGPAGRVGLEVRPELVDRMADDAISSDALPLLAYVLHRMWMDEDIRCDMRFDLAEYNALGGLEGAVEQAADEARLAARLMEKDHDSIDRRLQELFIPGLVELKDDDVVARSYSKLQAADRLLLTPFVERRLLLTDKNDVGDETVRVAHESLLRRWPVLARWIEENRGKLAAYAEISRDANDWYDETSGAGKAERLNHRDSRLDRAEALFAEKRFLEKASHKKLPIKAYLKACREAQNEGEEKRHAEQKRRARDAARIETERDGALITESRFLAGKAQDLIGSRDAGKALALAFMAIFPKHPSGTRPPVPEALSVLCSARRALSERLLLQGHEYAVFMAEFSPDGSTLLSVSHDGTARIWDSATGLVTVVFKERVGGFIHAVFSPDGRRVVTASREGILRRGSNLATIWNVRSGQQTTKLEGHEGPLNSAEFSPDGTLILTAAEDKTARLWDAQTGHQIAILKGHSDIVWHAAFCHDGKTALTFSADGTARLWDARTGQSKVTIQEKDSLIDLARPSPDGLMILTMHSDFIVRLWDALTGERVASLNGHEDTINNAMFSPDGTAIVTASKDKSVRLWDAKTGKLTAVLTGHIEEVTSAEFSPDGSAILTVSEDKTARLWDLDSGQQIAVLAGHSDKIWDARFSPDGKTILTASDDKTLRLWDSKASGPTMILNHQLKNPHQVWRACISCDGTSVLTSQNDGTVTLWDTQSGEHTATLGQSMVAFSEAVFSPDGDTFLVVSDQRAALYDIKSARQVGRLQGHEGLFGKPVFNPNGTQVLITSKKSVRLWDTRTGQQVCMLEGHKGGISDAIFSPDGNTVLSYYYSELSPMLWDAQTGKLTTKFDVKEHTLDSTAFSPDGTKILFASSNIKQIWDVQTGQKIKELEGYEGRASNAVFSPDGTKILACDGKIAYLWDAQTGVLFGELKGHLENVRSVVFSPDGTTILTASNDKTARLWDTQSGQQISVLEGHESEIHSAAFSLDGTTILTAGYNTVRLWQHFGGIEELMAEADGMLKDGSVWRDGVFRRLRPFTWGEAQEYYQEEHYYCRTYSRDRPTDLIASK